MTALKHKAAIIGLGGIGQDYDFDITDQSRILTHATAYANHDAFDLVAGVDLNLEARTRFSKKFHKRAFDSIETMYRYVQPEIISICVPTSLHWAVFKEVIRHVPLAIVCEKPLAATAEQGQEMVSVANGCGCALLVNYMRRFDPGINRLREAIVRGEYGLIRKGVVWYSKGMLNNGSHFIDLLSHLLGAVTKVNLLASGREFPAGDREPDVSITFGNVPVYFLAAREEDFSIREIELVTSDAMIYVQNDSITVKRAEESELFHSYRMLAAGVDKLPTDLNRYQYHVVDGLHRHLTAAAPLLSSGATALMTLSVVEQVAMLANQMDNA